MRRVLDQHEGHVFVYPSEGSREILLLYLLRWGFVPPESGSVWVRVDQRGLPVV